MNPDSAGSGTSSLNPLHGRQARGLIAAQACETCRQRKQKCDEQRPKCGLCLRMKLECRYREPQPTKKDKTLVEILDRLKIIEGKVDQIPSRSSAPQGFGPSRPSPSSQPSFLNDAEDLASYSTPSFNQSMQGSPVPGRIHQHRHAFASYKMLTWPVIQQVLLHSLPANIGDLKSIEQSGAAFVVQLQKTMPVLPLDERLQNVPFVGMQTQATRSTGAARKTFPALTRETMHRLATSFFDTFNFLYPFMDRQNFLSDTLVKVHSEGFDSDTDSVLALLVFALGELASEGAQGNPINIVNGRPSGVRGGTTLKPPGLALFNEARKHIGFTMTQCELENVQIFSLAALYCGSCFHHQDFWRLTVSASLAVQVLITCNTIDWNSARGDLIKRAHWHCAIMETSMHLELDLPLTGITNLEGVGIPSFNSAFCEADHRGNQSSHFQEHFASQVALRQLCATIHRTIDDTMSNSDTPSDDFPGPSSSTLKQIVQELAQWRGMISPNLQWPEDDPTSFPTLNSVTSAGFNQPLDPNLAPQIGPSRTPLFTSDLDQEPVHYPYVYDIQVALLRTRYYHAKYTAYRPYVYKALHFPQQMSQEDAEGVAECLRSCIKWPLLLSPTSRQKRLIPYMFSWSQNFLGVLLIFHVAKHNPLLRDIKVRFCGPRFEAECSETIDLMVDWIRDLKAVDPIALWCWKILQNIYRLGS